MSSVVAGISERPAIVVLVVGVSFQRLVLGQERVGAKVTLQIEDADDLGGGQAVGDPIGELGGVVRAEGVRVSDDEVVGGWRARGETGDEMLGVDLWHLSQSRGSERQGEHAEGERERTSHPSPPDC